MILARKRARSNSRKSLVGRTDGIVARHKRRESSPSGQQTTELHLNWSSDSWTEFIVASAKLRAVEKGDEASSPRSRNRSPLSDS